MIDLELAAEGVGVEAGEEIVVGGAEVLAVDDAEILVGAGEFNHKYIIAWVGGRMIGEGRSSGKWQRAEEKLLLTENRGARQWRVVYCRLVSSAGSTKKPLSGEGRDEEKA